jgi:hypothetical protein
MTVGGWVRLVLGSIVVGAIVWLLVAASTYNGGRMQLCESHNMVMAKEYPFGDYGCAKIIPFEELEKDG